MRPALLKCYLGKANDRQNMLVLYDHSLRVVFKGKFMDFSLGSIKGLTIGRKKLIIPLVIGGIGTCLSWLALSLGWYHYQTNLMLVFLFFGWMYYGFIGRDGLELTEGKHRHIFLIKANHFVLNTFLKFVKGRIIQRPVAKESICFHLATRESWESQEQSTLYIHPSLESEGFIHTSYLTELRSTYERYFKPSDQLVLLGIDLNSVEPKVEIQEVSDRQAHFPHIHGKLNKSAIIWLCHIQSPSDFEQKTID